MHFDPITRVRGLSDGLSDGLQDTALQRRNALRLIFLQ